MTPAFGRIQAELLEALARDELAEPLDHVVSEAYAKAVALLNPPAGPTAGETEGCLGCGGTVEDWTSSPMVIETSLSR